MEKMQNNNEINIHNVQSIWNLKIDYPDIYFTPEYGIACQYSDNAEWECCIYRDLMFVYLKKKYLDENNEIYYELLTPYGYSGYYFEKEETFNNFLDKFREIKKIKKYKKEIIRQNPYLNVKCNNIINNKYNVIGEKHLYYVHTNSFDDYFKNRRSKQRNIYRKGVKLNLKFDKYTLNKYNLNQLKFINFYEKSLEEKNADKYYYFNTNYFEYLCKLNGYICIIRNVENKIISGCIILNHNYFNHYHLSFTNKSYNCATDFLLMNIIKNITIGKTFVLGCGIFDGDSLGRFKKHLSTNNVKYKIFN